MQFAIRATQDSGNELQIRRIENHSNDLRVERIIEVNLVCNDQTFALDAPTYVESLFKFKSMQVILRTHD